MIAKDDDGELIELKGGGFLKIVRASRLRSLLAELDGDPFVAVNRVGNLTILTDDFNYIGFIDFNEEEIEYPAD
jgi:hypothetical protein